MSELGGEGRSRPQNPTTEFAQQWTLLERLPTYQRSRAVLFDEEQGDANTRRKRVIDVAHLGSSDRRLFVQRLLNNVEADNLCLLQKLRERFDKAGIKLPCIEIRYDNLSIEAKCKVVGGKPLPTLWNSLKDILSRMVTIHLTLHRGGEVVYNGEDGSSHPINRYVGGNSEYLQFSDDSHMGNRWYIEAFLMTVLIGVDDRSLDEGMVLYYSLGVIPLRMRELSKQSHLNEIVWIRRSQERLIDIFTMVCPHWRPIEGLALDDSSDEQAYCVGALDSNDE